MEIIVAENAGFCFGVERAYGMVLEALDDPNVPKPIYTLGCLIHNDRVVDYLKEKGIGWIDAVEDLPEGECGTVIIRSHGEPPATVDKLKDRCWHIIDATCPYVQNAQNIAQLLHEKQYKVIIYGDALHPEVKGILGYTKDKGIAVLSEDELAAIKLHGKIGLLAQTTKNFTTFQSIACAILPFAKELRIYNTICTVTKMRQEAAANLASKVDKMLVVGGKNSSNTKNLVRICKESGTDTYHIEGSLEINPEWFIGIDRVGITAGASTQQWIIKEVEEFMGELSEKGNNEQEIKKENSSKDILTDTNDSETDIQEETEDAAIFKPADDENVIHPMDTVEALGYNKSLKEFHKGLIIDGKIVEIRDDGIFVDVGYKTEGFVPSRELGTQPIDDPRELFEAGQEIKVSFMGTDENGQIKLSKRKADLDLAWDNIIEAQKNNTTLTGEVTKVVKGGLVADVGLRGFIPASHIAIEYIEDLSQFVGQRIEMKVLEVEKKNNNVVLSRKKVLEEEQAHLKEATLNRIAEGDIVEGLVTKIVDFGAFIDIGGIEGLLHISEMSWGRIEHPSKIISEGENIQVKILSIDLTTERISLGLKQVLPDPWDNFVAEYQVGDKIEGEITKIVSFGAFMEIKDGIEGLIHISQLARRHVESADEIVKRGDRVTAKIININKEERKVGLSLKEIEIEEHKKEISALIDHRDDSNITIADMVGDIFNNKKE